MKKDLIEFRVDSNVLFVDDKSKEIFFELQVHKNCVLYSKDLLHRFYSVLKGVRLRDFEVFLHYFSLYTYM